MLNQKKEANQREQPEEIEISGPDDLLGSEPKGLLGAKRLNNRPVLVGGVVAAAFGLVMVYTMNERSKPYVPKDDEAVSAEVNGKAGAKTAPPEVVQNAQQGGLIAANYSGTYEVMPDGTQVPVLVEQHPVNTAASSGYSPAPQSPYATQWDSYHSARDQQRQQRYETRMSAIAAGTGVAVQNQSGPLNPPSNLIPASMGAMQANGAITGGFPQQTGPSSYDDEDLNRQGAKRGFVDGSGGRQTHLSNRVESARSSNEVKAGSVIPIVLTASVNTDLPGQVTAAVSRNVYDTATGQRLLIPQGTRLVGQYHSQVTTGQSRVLIAWNRLIFSDGSSLDIGSMPGADLSGASGARDQVNNHYRRTFGNAVFLSLFSAGVQLSQPQSAAGENQTASQTVAAAMGQQLGQLGMETARRNMQIQPTLQLRPGLNMNIQVTQDITLREWRSR